MSTKYYDLGYITLLLFFVTIVGVVILVWVAGNQPLEEVSINLNGDWLQFTLRK